jgi:hypothetical protein
VTAMGKSPEVWPHGSAPSIRRRLKSICFIFQWGRFGEVVTTGTRGLRQSAMLDLVILSSTGQSPRIVDELRIGPTWRSVVPMRMTNENQRSNDEK